MENHTLRDAYFINNERTAVTILWEDNDNPGTISVEYAQAAENDGIWMDLIENHGIDIDWLHERTYKYIKETQIEFENFAIETAKQRGLVYDSDVDSNLYTNFADFLFEKKNEEDEEASEIYDEKLFLYKLALFEHELVQLSEKTELKKQLRQSRSILEATKIVMEILENNENTS